MLVMTKKKPGRPPKPRPTEPLQIRLDPDLARALEALAARNLHTRTQEVVRLIEEAVKAAGLFPKKEAE